MFDFLNVFSDFFFMPLKSFDVNSNIYVLIYTVLITLAVWSFLRRILSVFSLKGR